MNKDSLDLASQPKEINQAHWPLILRLLRLTWKYRVGCLHVLSYQLFLLTLGLSGLSFTGLGIDYVYSQVDKTHPAPHWPWGFHPPPEWSPIHVVLMISGAILLFAVIRAGLNHLYSIAVFKLVQNEIVVDLRAQVYEKLQRLSFRFYDENASGSIINRVTVDVQQVRMFIDGVMIQSIIMVLSLIVYLTYMVSLHAMLTLACLSTLPVLWMTTILFSRKIRPAYRENRKLVDDMITHFAETVQGILVVKGFAQENSEIKKFRRANDHVQNQQESIFFKVSCFQPLTNWLTQVNLVVLLYYGGKLTIAGELPLGTGLVVFAGLLQQFSGQVGNIANITNSMQQSLIGARRVFEILDSPIEIHSKPDALRLPRARGHVRLDHVSFSYREKDLVLEDINLDVQPGQCVAILGMTGAGKSTLMSLIPRFYDPTNGRIFLDGHDIRDLDLTDLRKNIGIVFQENFLFNKTVAENIAFGHPKATQEQIEKAARMAAAHDFILTMPEGYKSMIRESGSNLSGGQRQRLAIARALLLEPAVLLLDDPTAAIDSETEHEIFESIDQAIEGRTTFIVAHRLSTLRRANLIVVMKNGRIVQSGTHESLMRQQGPYHRVAMLQLSDQDSHRFLSEAPGGLS